MENQSPYKELDRRDSPQIRLLKIESAKSKNEVIKVNLYTKSLDKSPPFKALSYVWGDSKYTSRILLNGVSFGVTWNLYDALEILRSKSNEYFIWVDALCVNQKDASEKGHQVSLMARIYSEAHEVLCWLGPSMDDGSVLPFLRKCAELGREQEVPLPTPDILTTFASKSNAIRSILLRQYWYRVWVVQENALAKKRLYLCGSHEISSDDLYWGLAQIKKTLFLAPKWLCNESFLQAADDVHNFHGYKMLANTLIAPRKLDNHAISELLSQLNEVMMDTARLMATDPRDHLYGILGLFPDLAHLIKVDYAKSPPATYLDLALLNLKENPRLIARSGVGHKYCTRGRRSCDNLPSWVPNHSGPFVESYAGISLWTKNRYLAFEAGTFFAQELKWHVELVTLVLLASGVEVGRITSVSSSNMPFNKRMVEWDCCAATNATKHAYSTWRWAFYRTILMDRDRVVLDFQQSPKNENETMNSVDEQNSLSLIHSMSVKDAYVRLMRSAFSSYPRRISRTKIGHDPPVYSIPSLRAERSYWLQKNKKSQLNDLYHSGDNQPRAQSFSHNKKRAARVMLGFLKRTLTNEVDRITRDRSFILTESGHIGLAPLGVQVGDHVVVIGGCTVPLVLRKHGEAFQVIGDTYVCGLMKGQVSENVSAGTAHIEEFKLI